MSKAKWGGNRKPQTFRDCHYCGMKFGPLDNLKRMYCSNECKYSAIKLRPPKVVRVATKEARYAQRRISYLVESGRLLRPLKCEQCFNKAKIEAAHFDYDHPEMVRWLCRPCHRVWDKKIPKGGTVILKRWENFTGNKATLESV